MAGLRAAQSFTLTVCAVPHTEPSAAGTSLGWGQQGSSDRDLKLGTSHRDTSHGDLLQNPADPAGLAAAPWGRKFLSLCWSPSGSLSLENQSSGVPAWGLTSQGAAP